MPRWNRREKPDYRHLRDVTDEAALVNAIRSPTYGEEHEHGVMASIQSRILGMFGEADALYLAQLVPAHEAARSADPSFPGHGRDWKSTFVHDVVGNAVGWGMRLGVLREAPNPGGDRLFLLEIRAPLFERMGNGKWRKVDLERSAQAPATERRLGSSTPPGSSRSSASSWAACARRGPPSRTPGSPATRSSSPG